MMMGTAEAPEQAARVTVSAKVPQHPAVVIQDLTADDETGVQALCGLSLSVHAHEIVDIAGVASGSNDNTVKVWDAQTGQELLSLQGHSRWVNSVAFSPAGKRLARASVAKTGKQRAGHTSQ